MLASIMTRRTSYCEHLDYLAFIDIYHERIKAFHVKDADCTPTGRQGVYSGFQPWVSRAGRFRSLGDGQVDLVLCSRRWRNMITTAGRCSNGNAALKHPRTARATPVYQSHLIV